MARDKWHEGCRPKWQLSATHIFLLLSSQGPSNDNVDIIALAAVVIARRKRRRRYWAHPYLRDNVDLHSTYVVSRQLEMHSEKF